MECHEGIVKTLKVYKASPVIHHEPVESVILEINGNLPDDPSLANWQKRINEFYNDQAKIVMEALDQLPQGTKHRLLILMLEKQASYYRGT